VNSESFGHTDESTYAIPVGMLSGCLHTIGEYVS